MIGIGIAYKFSSLYTALYKLVSFMIMMMIIIIIIIIIIHCTSRPVYSNDELIQSSLFE